MLGIDNSTQLLEALRSRQRTSSARARARRREREQAEAAQYALKCARGFRRYLPESHGAVAPGPPPDAPEQIQYAHADVGRLRVEMDSASVGAAWFDLRRSGDHAVVHATVDVVFSKVCDVCDIYCIKAARASEATEVD